MHLAHQRCFSHPAREAVCRCPECARFFCRECVTDFEGRLLCAFCIRRLAVRAQTSPRRRWLAAIGHVVAAISALFLSWAFFDLGGSILRRFAQGGGQ